MTSVPLLSTKTGLLYGYEQREVEGGVYEWFVSGREWDTGEVIWEAVMGRGGSFNDGWMAMGIGPDERIYQGIFGGVGIVEASD